MRVRRGLARRATQACGLMSEESRFRAGIVIEQSGCWTWQRAATHDGYGQFGTGSRKDGSFRVTYVHVWSYRHHVGPIPPGLELDHLCKNRRCANPAHLEPVTHAENVMRGGGHNRGKMVCVAGHALEGANVWVSPSSGKRACVECRRRRNREHGKRTGWAAASAYRARKKEASGGENRLG